MNAPRPVAQAEQADHALDAAGVAPLSLVPLAAAPVPARAAAAANAVTPADLLVIAMQSENQDIDRLERLMAMDLRYREQQALELTRQREWQEQDRQRDAVLAFRESFAAFRGENIVIPHTKHVDRGNAGSFEQAEYHLVSGMLSPALSKHGFGYHHKTEFTTHQLPGLEGPDAYVPWVKVTVFLQHRKGHVESMQLEGPPNDLKGNTPIQNMQAAASYMKRRSLLDITGTATGGEDDEAKLVQQQKGEAKSNAADQLRDAGRAASMEGMAKLTEWWKTLNAKDQAAMSKDFGEMRKAARRADEEDARHV